jgi:hypothetical protein
MRPWQKRNAEKMKQAWNAIVWWEIRRILFNAALAIAGTITIVTLLWIWSYFVAPGEDVVEPPALFFLGMSYAIAANIFYTMGGISELLWSGGDTSRTQPFRKRVFVLALVMSCAFTMVPAVLVPLLWWTLGFHHGPDASMN